MIFGVYSEAVMVVRHCVKKVRSFKKCDGEKLCCELLEAPWFVMDSLTRKVGILEVSVFVCGR